MNIKTNLKRLIIVSSLVVMTNMTYAEQFKRFSVSAGWMHVMPQGKANPFKIFTPIGNNVNAYVGPISVDSFLNSIDPNAMVGSDNLKFALESVFADEFMRDMLTDSNGDLLSAVSGTAQINGLDHWEVQGTGLKAKNVNTLGLTFNYYLNDHVSIQFIGGIPPTVDIKGVGAITAPLNGIATSDFANDPTLGLLEILFPDGVALQQDIPITNLSNKKKASSVRAWTPALEVQYQFGQSGVDKFRPFIGGGLMYAYFNKIKLDSTIKSDLVEAGHMIQNLMDAIAGNSNGNGPIGAGAALDGAQSNADPHVRVKTTDAIAPLVTFGATYDINENWYGIASLSYAKLNNRANIDVIDKNTGNTLIHSSTKIDIDPLITYVGVGYRF